MSINLLCEDVINEILKYCDSRTTSSFFSINKYVSVLSKKNKKIIHRRMLKKELNHTIYKIRYFYNKPILNLSINDRVTDGKFNYRVMHVTNKYALLQQVDMLGNKIDKQLKYITLEQDEKTKQYDWYLEDCIIMYGIIKHEFGPLIKHIDSHYLNYLTFPRWYQCYLKSLCLPEKDMLVTVIYKDKMYEYVITYLLSNYMTLQLIGNNNIKNNLDVNLIHGEWKVTNRKYTILQFGSWVN